MTPSTQRRPLHPRNLRLRTLALAVASALAGTAWANPTGPSVAAGAASFSTSGNTLNITNTPGTIINWQQFSIRPDEVTRFIQSGAMSAVLNRVTGHEHSQLLGQLLSNGRVFLVNPNGITIGQGALIDTAGFVASSLNISDADFLSGRMRFQALAGEPGKVVNQGTLSAHSGGQIYLIAPNVENHGVITAPNGDVLLAAGKSVEVVSSASPHIRVELNAPDNGEALNVGQVVGGRIGIYGGLVAHSGTASADRVEVGDGGNIILRASKVLQTGVLSANAAQGRGGNVEVRGDTNVIQTQGARISVQGAEGGGTATVATNADGGYTFTSATIDATSVSGSGGAIHVLGESIALAGASIDASGATRGGTVLVGGDRQGANPDVPNARSVFGNFSTAIKADATTQGDGGKVVVWSDHTTRFGGALSARAGANRGDGGFIEVSGKQTTVFAGTANASSPYGRAGTFLLDPKNIFIDEVTSGVSFRDLLDPNPNSDGQGGNGFGNYVVATVGGNTLVTDAADNLRGVDAGAAYIYDGATGALRSTLLGAAPGDRVGSYNSLRQAGSNYLLFSPEFGAAGNFDNALGAVTFINAASGTFAGGGGPISAANSLVGAAPGDRVGSETFFPSPSVQAHGNYAFIFSRGYGGGAGAVTTMAVADGRIVNAPADSGAVIGTGNSFVGATPNAQIGNWGADVVGNLLVMRSFATASPGALTFLNSVTGATPSGASHGVIDATNSIVGSLPGDLNGALIESVGVGSFVLRAPNWGGSQQGAVTWISPVGTLSDGTPAGAIGPANSVVGQFASDRVGSQAVIVSGPSYAIATPDWNGGRGAVTLVDFNNGRVLTTNGTGAVVAPTNSIVGSAAGDRIGSGGVAGTGHGFLVLSPDWNGQRGAVTWLDSNSGVDALGMPGIGEVTLSNSLGGSTPLDRVGNSFSYLFPATGSSVLVASPDWTNAETSAPSAGAVTFIDLVTGRTPAGPAVGEVSKLNSLVGDQAFDAVGGSYIVPIFGGNVFIVSNNWRGGQGAVTWMNAADGRLSNMAGLADYATTTGVLTSANSLAGTGTPADNIGFGGVRVVDGNAFVLSPDWNQQRGAVTWISGATGRLVDGNTGGSPNVLNSLIGSTPGDRVGDDVATTSGLFSQNLIVRSRNWQFGGQAVGAITFLRGSDGALSTMLDGIDNATFADAGQAYSTLLGAVSSANSLVGSAPGEMDSTWVEYLSTGHVLHFAQGWSAGGTLPGAGAVTWMNGDNGRLVNGATGGVISPANSIVGAAAGDNVGAFNLFGAFNPLSQIGFTDKYLLRSAGFNGNSGAVTWIDGATGLLAGMASPTAFVNGTISAANSLVGSGPGTAGIRLGEQMTELPDGLGGANLLFITLAHGNGVGAVTWMNGATGALVDGSSSATVSAANSLVGNTATDALGSGGVVVVGRGPGGLANAVVLSPSFDADGGAATWINGATGELSDGTLARGAVTTSNSLLGNPGDRIGSGFAATAGATRLGSAFNVAISSPDWNGERGAVTWMNGGTGALVGGATGGVVGPGNSLVGTNPAGALAGDRIGSQDISPVSGATGSYFLVYSPNWAGGRGAVTRMNAADGSLLDGPAGEVTTANSVVGVNPGDGFAAFGDRVGGGLGEGENPLRTLANGSALLISQGFGDGAGAVTLLDAELRTQGIVNPANSVIGRAPFANLRENIVDDAANNNALAVFAAEGTGRVAVISATLGAGGTAGNLPQLFQSDPTGDVTVTPATIQGALDNGTRVILQANNDIEVNRPIAATGTNTFSDAALVMQAGRSIRINVNANITNTNSDDSGDSIILIANESPTAAPTLVTGEREPGLAEIRMAPGTLLQGSGNVRIEMREGTGPGTAGGITLANVSSGNDLEVVNAFTANRVADANRTIDLLPGSQLSAPGSTNLVADGDVRFGVQGSPGPTAIGGSGGFNVDALGTLTGGTGTLINLATGGVGPIELRAASIGTPTNPIGFAFGSQGLEAYTSAGGIHLAATAGDLDVGFLSALEAPAGQQISIGALAGNMRVAQLNPLNANPTKLYTNGGEILFDNAFGTISPGSLLLDGPGLARVAGTGATFLGGVTSTRPFRIEGGSATFNGTADFNGGLTVVGNGTTLDVGAPGATASSLTWNSAFGETNTITGAPGATLTVTGTASIGGAGTPILEDATLAIGSGASATFSGPASFLLGGAAGIVNDGTFTLAGTQSFNSNAGLVHTFLNRGTLVKSGGGQSVMGSGLGTGVALQNAGIVNVGGGQLVLNLGATHTGSFNVAGPGDVLAFASDAHTLQGDVTGAGTIEVSSAGTSLDIASPSFSIGTLNITGGATFVNGTATVGTFYQSGGSIEGTSGTLDVLQSFSGGGAFGPFLNLYVNQAAGDLDTGSIGGAATGSVRFTAPAGTLTIPSAIDVAGAAELGGQTVVLQSDVSASTIRLVSPNVQVQSVTLAGALDASAASLTLGPGHTLQLPGTAANIIRDLAIDAAGTTLVLGGPTTVAGNFQWQGGIGTSTISGGTLTVNGSSAIGGDGTHVLDNVQLVNNGNMIFGPTFGLGGPLRIENAAQLTNNGTFNLQNDQPIRSDAGTGTLRNVGTLLKTATPSGITQLGGGTGTFVFDNDGQVQIDAGVLAIAEPGSGAAQTGSYSMGPAGGITFSNGTHVLNGSITGGTLGVSGTGDVTIAGALTTNVMQIGGGVLAINGSANTNLYNQTGGLVGGTGDLAVASSFSQTGGSFGNTFNSLSITQAAGDIEGSGFGATGALSLAAPAGVVNVSNPLSLAGSASFFGGAGINVTAPVTAASVGMVTGGTARISNATVQATNGAIVVSAGQVEVTGGSAAAGLLASSGLTVVSLGDVILQGGSAPGSHAELNAGTGPLAMSVQRNLKLAGGAGSNAYALVVGDPDVGSAASPIKVGRIIQMQAGSGDGATARIESVSPNSIYVLFPNASTGGYFVNGVEATSLDGSGFFAGGQPAILGQNLFVEYGVPTSALVDPAVVLTALDRSTQPLGDLTDEQRRRELQALFEDIEDAPVCK